MILPQDCPKAFTINTLGLCRVYYGKKKCWTYGGQLHAWVAFLIKITHLGMGPGNGGRISIDICIDPLTI